MPRKRTGLYWVTLANVLGLAAVLIANGIVVFWFNGSDRLRLFWPMIWGLAILMNYVVCESRQRQRRRRDCYELLGRRADVDMKAEVARLASTHSIAATDALMDIWIRLAHFYEVPPTKLRTSDELLKELEPLWTDMDYDLFYFIESRRIKEIFGILRDRNPSTWGDLVIAIYYAEAC